MGKYPDFLRTPGVLCFAAMRLWYISLIGLLLSQTVTMPGQNSIDFNTIAKQADRAMQDAIKTAPFHGAVLVVKNGQAIFRRAYGLADAAWDVPNTPDTKFNIGSLTKQFTGMAVLQLASQGRVSLDDPINKYLDVPASWQAITIRHLLEHRSGLTGPAGPTDYPRGIGASYSATEIVNFVAAKPIEFAPGSRFKYTNAGYYVLGALIERVARVPYAEYMRKSIFQPIGMGQSGFDSVTTIIPHRALGYSGEPGRLEYALHVDWSLAFSAGGLYSTLDDLLAWDRGLSSATWMDATVKTQLLTPTDRGYNFGWFVDRVGGRLRMYHEGSNPGYASFIYRFPEEHLLVVVLSNFEGTPVKKIADSLVAAAGR